METALLLGRFLLAGVFGVAGVAKLRDLEGSRRGVRDFGVPEGLAGPLGVVLPLAELAVALALLPAATAWWGALGAAGLLLAFVAAISVNLARGRKPDCRCFGQIASGPIGPSTLARNGVLLVVAAALVVQGPARTGPGLTEWLAEAGSAGLALVVAALALVGAGAAGWWASTQARRNGELQARLADLEARLASGAAPAGVAPAASGPGLAIGSAAPGFSLAGVYGETQTLEALRSGGKPVLLLFTDPHCGPCNSLMPDIGRWQRELSERLTVAVISRGAQEANRAKASEHGLANVLLQRGDELAESFLADATPGAVVVRADGTVGSPLAFGPDEIRALVARTVGSAAYGPSMLPAGGHDHNGQAHGNGVAPTVALDQVLGQKAPALELPDLNGKPVRLADFQGQRVVVLFWRPGCGYCQRMLDDLKRWEETAPAEAPRLLVVSSESVEANREQGLRSMVVLDQEFVTGNAFGASGTPSAVLVDAKGNLASTVVVGAESVLALANGMDPRILAAGPPPQKTPQPGEPAPPFELPDLDGKRVSLADLAGRKTMLLFWGPSCSYCQEILPELQAWEREEAHDAPRLVLISSGGVEANRAQGLRSTVLLDDAFKVGNAYVAGGTPAAVLIDEAGKIAAAPVGGGPAVLALAYGLDRGASEGQPALKVGDPVPRLRLPDVDGKLIDLSELRGSETLVLFWDPECSFCKSMLPALQAWEREAPPTAPRLVMISSGGVEAVRAQELRSLVLRDSTFRAGRAFGATGTPMGALLDAEGRLAWPLVAGAEAILKLARSRGGASWARR